MRHLRASESIHDNLARDAAIAEMGRRLAAQALRTRRRQNGHLVASRDASGDPVSKRGPAPLPVTRQDALAAACPLPEAAKAPTPRPAMVIPWGRYAAILRRTTLLGATAACGFSLVLYAENLRVTASHQHPTPVAEAASKAAAPPVIGAPLPENPPPLIQESLAAGTLPEPPAEQGVFSLSALPTRSVAAQQPPLEVAAQVRPAPVFARDPIQPRHTRRAAPPAPLLLARAAPRARSSPHVTLAKFEFPRWLTERRTYPAPRIMSDAPHDLALPKTAPARLAAVKQAPATAPAAEPEPAPRPRPPRAIYATTQPYPGYGAPYGYAYPNPYPLPRLRQPAFYTAQAPEPEEGPDQP